MTASYPRAVVTRQQQPTLWVGIGADGRPEWRQLHSWQVHLFKEPNRIALAVSDEQFIAVDKGLPEQVFQDHEHAIRWAHEVIASVRRPA